MNPRRNIGLRLLALRGIGEMEEEIGKKISEKMGRKKGRKMGGKMGEQRCEGERETAPVSSSISAIVKCTVVTDSGPLAWEDGTSFGPLVKS
jgi:hypothetical protein